jgi:hypothetical protein
MSYVRTGLGVTRDQQSQLLKVTDEELAALPTDVRLNLVLRRQEVKASELAARWSAVATAIAVAVPILAVFGITMRANK